MKETKDTLDESSVMSSSSST
jgi:serum/glucocorticoid-regulated kinase 2